MSLVIRRARFVAFLFAICVLPTSLRAQRRPLVFIENSNSADLSVIEDGNASTVAGTIDIGAAPDDIVSSPSGDVLYVCRIMRRPPGQVAAVGDVLGEVVAVDPQGRAVLWRAPVSGVPNHLVVSADGKTVFAAIVSSNHVDVIDVARHAVFDSVVVGAGPHDIQLSADGRTVYVGMLRAKTLVAFDANTRKVLQTIQMADGVRPFAVTRDQKTVFIQLSHTHGFVVVDLQTGKSLRTVDLPVPSGFTLPATMPGTVNHGIGITRDEKYLFANGSIADIVAVYSLPGLDLIGTVPVGRDPNWVTFSPDGARVYVTNRGSDDVSVIDVATRTEIERLKVGKYPQRMTSVTVAGS